MIRDSAVRALVLAGVFVTLITEGLSALHLIQHGPLIIAWLLALVAVVAMFRRWQARVSFPKLGVLDWAILAGIAAIVAIIGLIAVVSPPNSSDAMAYHMPRVVYWAQQRGVAFFPTPYLNQIMLQPLAEYFMLHTYVLSGGDHLINCIQLLGCISSIVCVSLIAKVLGAGARGQILAALFCATLPNGILQASGAKNDYLLALWLAAMAYFALRFTQQLETADLVFCGCALGLALLTKATAYIYVPGVLIAIFAPGWRKINLIRTGLILVGCAVALNAPQYARNLDLSGSPLGFDSAQANGFFRWRNEKFGWKQTASNVLRNAADQAGSRKESWNRSVYDVVLRVHKWIGIDANDPDTTWRWTTYEPPRNSNHETNANNRWHLLILLGVLAALLVECARKKDASAKARIFYLAGLLLGFVLFCFYLKWQPFLSRMFLPLFVLAAPVAGAELEKLRPVVLQWVLCLFLLNNSRPYLFENWVRPLKGPNSILATSREDKYFSDMTHWHNRDSYFPAVKSVSESGCNTVGIDTNDFQLEYPFQALLREARPAVTFVHTAVTNPSAKYQRHDIEPCAVLCMNCAGKIERLDLYRDFPKQVPSGDFVVFLR